MYTYAQTLTPGGMWHRAVVQAHRAGRSAVDHCHAVVDFARTFTADKIDYCVVRVVFGMTICECLDGEV